MKDALLPPMVADKDIYQARASWGRRAETPEALAARWIALITRFQTIDPAFAQWWHRDDNFVPVPFDPRIEAQVPRVLKRMERTASGRLVPEGGAKLGNISNPDWRSWSLKVDMYAGSDNPYNSNGIGLRTDFHVVPVPELVTFRIFRSLVLAMAETFEATEAVVWRSDLYDLWTRERIVRHELQLGWISYIAPRFAHLVTPPRNVIVEHRPDGGLLMAATDETFSTDNPTHLAAARAIEAALQPYNALPWTVEAGK